MPGDMLHSEWWFNLFVYLFICVCVVFFLCVFVCMFLYLLHELRLLPSVILYYSSNPEWLLCCVLARLKKLYKLVGGSVVARDEVKSSCQN